MRLPTLALAALAAFAAPSHGHSPGVGANGGRQVDAGAFHVEMVVEGPNLTIFVRDHADRPVVTDGFRGAAIITLDGRAQRIPLAPAGENRLTGSAPAPLPERPKGVVQVITGAGASMQGRFD
jgi:hypothetical protein